METPPVLEAPPLPPVLEKKRFHDLDALRAFAMLLGIVLHGVLSFFPVPIWPAQDLQQPMVDVPAAMAAPLETAGLEVPEKYSLYEFALHAIHGFRLPLFFLVSGFFTVMLWRNRGLKQLAKHRAKRILLPLVIFVPIIWILLIPVGIYGGFKKEEVRKRAGSLYSEAGDSKGVIEQSDDSKSEGALPNKNVSKLEGPLKKFKYRVYYQQFTSLPDFDKLKPEFSGESEEGIIDLGLAKRKEEFGMVFEGELEIKEAGEFNFRLGSDDGSRLFINEKKLIDNDGTHGVQYMEGSVPLEPGMAKIRVDYFDWGGGQGLSLSVSGPGMDELSDGSDELFLSEEKGREVGDVLGLLVMLIFFAPVFHHLWFLYYLVWLVAGFIAITWLLGKLKWKALPDWLVTSPLRWLWLLPVTLVAQLLMPDDFGPATATGFLPWPPILIYYAIFFGFGALCYGRDSFENKTGKLWPLHFVLALPLLFAGLCLVRSGSNGPLLAAVTVAYTWLMIFGFIGFFRHFFSGENKLIRYISDSSYWLYIMHLPIIMFVQAWISPWDLPAFPKFLIACALTTLPLLVMYEFIVRYTFIGTLLNGKRTRGG